MDISALSTRSVYTLRAATPTRDSRVFVFNVVKEIEMAASASSSGSVQRLNLA